jgi:hypothetical protein
MRGSIKKNQQMIAPASAPSVAKLYKATCKGGHRGVLLTKSEIKIKEEDSNHVYL